jgi:hypothetical protein
MPLEDRIVTYSVSVLQSNIHPNSREIRLGLESGGVAFIGFQPNPPPRWLQFDGSTTYLYLPEERFDDVYRVIETESPVFFTALDLFGLETGAVHTELDLSAGETPGEGDRNPQSLEAVVRRARQHAARG